MATNPYVNKVVYGNSTVMDISGDTATPSDVLAGATFHDRSGAAQVGTLSLDEFATIDLLKDTVGWTGKNLLEVSSASQTINGVTFTVNSDKSVTVNGTASAQAEFTLLEDSNNSCPFNGCILSGCPSGGSNSTYDLRVSDVTTGSNADYGNGDAVTISLTSTGQWKSSIVVRNGQTVNNLRFYPMIRKASISDSTFEPYHESVEVCKFNRSEQRVLGAKNLLNPADLKATRIKNGVTLTNNGDGTFSLSGTCGGNSACDITSTSVQIPNGDYKLSVSGAKDGFKIAGYVGGTETQIAYVNKDVVIDFTATSTYSSYVIQVNLVNGNSYEGITLKPMLRLASDPDNTYVPYAMTNKELTDSKANASDLDGWTSASTVANGSVSFSGLDDTQGWSYHPVFWVDGNSTNLNPTAELSTISGTGTSSMSVTYTTDADNGASCKLRIEK